MSAILNIAPKTPEAEEPTRQVLISELRVMRSQAKIKEKVEIVKQLSFEKDDRFFCVMSEQFRKEGNVLEQVHYYRNLGKHQFIVTVVAKSEPEDVKSLREAAEKVALSATLVPKGEKAPPPPKVSAELAKDAKYKAAKAKADAAEAKLNELRGQQPPDRAAIAQASEDWLDAKRPVEAMRQAALAKDAEVIAAKNKVAEARAKK